MSKVNAKEVVYIFLKEVTLTEMQDAGCRVQQMPIQAAVPDPQDRTQRIPGCYLPTAW